MFKNKTVMILFLIITAIFGATFYFGVIVNPNFNIYDFCMNLASEILGLVIALILVDTYVVKKREAQQTAQNKQ